jgi:hypothetical protein
VGTASTLEQFTAGTDNELDVIDTNSSVYELKLQQTPLIAGDVYTLFVTGSSPSTVTYTLRENR